MRIVGIDPSLTGTGFADTLGETYTVGAVSGEWRLMGLYHATQLQADACDFAVLEDLPTHGMGAGKTGMAQGVVRLALMSREVPYITVSPATLKKFATGRGNAPKSDMRMELYKRAVIDLADDNQVDAWWLRQLGLWHYGLGEIKLPALHTDCLAKVDWTGAPEAVAA